MYLKECAEKVKECYRGFLRESCPVGAVLTTGHFAQPPFLCLTKVLRGRRAVGAAVLGSLSSMLVLQQVTPVSNGIEPSAPSAVVVADLGAGGNTVPVFAEPPTARAGDRPLPREAAGNSPRQSKLVVPGIPRTLLAAYRDAMEDTREATPGCHLSVPLLAAIGRVESGHARGGDVDRRGTTNTPILGPRLDGSPGVAAIEDTDGGIHDGDPVWDRAVGPMQFIPSTWQRWGADGNADGTADPNNVFDAALAAGLYLCAAGGDLASISGPERAILAYNHSRAYLGLVLSWMRVYAGGTTAAPDLPNTEKASTEDNNRRNARPDQRADAPAQNGPERRPTQPPTSRPPDESTAPKPGDDEPHDLIDVPAVPTPTDGPDPDLSITGEF